MTTTAAPHRTNDMTLVAFLATRHILHSDMDFGDGNVHWLIPQSAALERELDEFRLGNSKVEPVQFARQLVNTRKELFKFIEDNQQSQRVA